MCFSLARKAFFFVIRHYDYDFLIGILDTDALVWQEKLFFPSFSFKSKVVCQVRQTWFLLETFIFCDYNLQPFGHYDHYFCIRILHTDALVWHEKVFFPPFSLKSKFIRQIRKTWILIRISILFVIELYKHFLLVGIHDNNTLFCQEKFFLPPFSFESKFIMKRDKLGYS